MASEILYSLFFLAATITLVSGQAASCHDCDPRNFREECADPVASNVRTVNCNPDVFNGTTLCVSAYFNYTGDKANETGIYRGCRTLRPDVQDYCDWFKQGAEYENLTITTCLACNTTRCNVVRFNSDGTSAAVSFELAVVLVLNALFVLLLGVFK